MYLHQLANWPEFTWDYHQLATKLGEVRYKQGKILGQMNAAGFDLKEEALLQTLTLDVIKSSEIEGEILNIEQVRSSIAKRLGIPLAGLVHSSRQVDGVVEMMLDATQNYDKTLTADRLYGWHGALFPTGRSGLYAISVASWRNDQKGPMQVVSGAIGREKVHFEAPVAGRVPQEMDAFLKWFNAKQDIDPVIKAGIAHLWFVTIHPFEDGNGRITRALTDMLLARADQTELRFYSMSAQIQKERNVYYDILEKTQQERMNITEWLIWFLDCLDRSMDSTNQIMEKISLRTHFWDINKGVSLNARQKKVLDILLDNFFGKLTSSKWAKMTSCSTDTALRDIQDLIAKGILTPETAGGRSTSYQLKQPE
jgi:Fic family protein